VGLEEDRSPDSIKLHELFCQGACTQSSGWILSVSFASNGSHATGAAVSSVYLFHRIRPLLARLVSKEEGKTSTEPESLAV
jgi:hypothetical protein